MASVRQHKMKDWYCTFADDLWLKPDDVGAEEAAFIKKALRLRRGQSVLDAPCGAGRIAIHLAHAGCRVTGIDLKRSFIKRAATRFRREEQNGCFLPVDMRDMSFSDEFHGILNWGGSFGFFAEADNLDVLRRYAAALRKGGRLLIDQTNRQALLRNFVACRKASGSTVRNRWSPGTQRVESDWIVHRRGKKEHNRMSVRLYTPSQMAKLFERVGLRIESTFGSIAGEPYQRSSKRLIVVGRKQDRPAQRLTLER